MPEHDDTPLAGPDAGDKTPVQHVSLNVPDPDPAPERMLTISEVLEEARLPEDYARICLRADLEADLTRLEKELAGLVGADGKLVEDDDEESTLGDAQTRGAQARVLGDQIKAVRSEMADSVRFVRFRGLSSDASQEFDERHQVKAKEPSQKQIGAFNDQLIAATAIEPRLSVEEMRQLRGKLGPRSIAELARVAKKVCTQGGVDVPKSPVSLLNLTQR